jgi:hypothetical protein
MTNQQNASGGNPRPPWIVVGILVVIGVVVGFVSTNRGPENAPPPSTPTLSLSADEANQLVDQIRIAIGDLENEDFKKALAVFCPAAKKLPNEPIVIRNRAISYVAPYLLPPGDVDETEMWKALEDLQQVEPDSFVTHWLVAKAAWKKHERTRDPEAKAAHLNRAVAALEKAGEVSPDNAVVWIELYRAVQFADDPALQQKTELALDNAFRSAPRNIYVLTEQMDFQRQNEDADLLKTLDVVREALGPLTARINHRSKIDLNDYFDQARKGIESGDLQAVNLLRQIMSPVRAESVSRSDLRRIESNPLEYVVDRFSEAFRKEYPLRLPTQPTPTDITLTPLALPNVDQLTDVVDFQFVDFDLNGNADLVVLRENRLDVFGRAALDAEWEPICSLELAGGARGLLAADLDRDNKIIQGEAFFKADVDLVVFGSDGFHVLENRFDAESETRSLVEIEHPAETRQLHDVTTGAIADIDHDGDLDLVLAEREGLSVWSNRENLTFAETTQWSTFPTSATAIRSIVPVDWDRDVDIDFVLAGDGMPPGYLENLRHGELRWREFDSDLGLGSASNLAVLEADGNGSWDLVAVQDAGLGCSLTSTPEPGVVASRRADQVATTTFEQATTWDYDNDGFLDLLAWSGDSTVVFRGLVEGRFVADMGLSEELPTSIEHLIPADLDVDGDLDLIVRSGGRLLAFENEGGNRNNSLVVQLLGKDDDQVSGRVNHFAIGSLLEIKTGDRYQAEIVRGQVTHFGIGSPARADVLRALLTNGIPQAVIRPDPSKVIHEAMRLKGSCPYVYTWNGERFEFYTDLLWAAPIGLQLADGVIAPDRPAEFLKIEGENLKPQDGQYSLQVTEELWEAAYFDTIELIAIDHPADVEIFSNEKVGPAEIAEFKVHTVRQRQLPGAVMDSLGRDVLEILRTKDGHFWKGFERRYRQGLVDEHFLELDLGELPDPKQITLFLTGWIYPTDTSLNVALSGNPNLPHPRPPSIQVPDENGEWTETIPYMGFPGGKTKTIAVDLSNAFLTQDYRLRIVTSAEIYWDEVFFTVDDPAAEIEMMPLTLKSADLHQRGFSRSLRNAENAPETYDYDSVTTTAKWPPMGGYFTRYGDVRELIAEADDRMVVMGAGDEMTLKFDVPPEDLPEGWTRDFIMHNVGWDKDADLNTIYGTTVDPLPYRGMSSYPYGPEDNFPETQRHREYLERYQTRLQDPSRFWRWIKDYRVN